MKNNSEQKVEIGNDANIMWTQIKGILDNTGGREGVYKVIIRTSYGRGGIQSTYD